MHQRVTGLQRLTVKLKLYQNIGPIRNTSSNCYLRRQVPVPLFLSASSSSAPTQYNRGQSVVESVERRGSPPCLYTSGFVTRRLSTVISTKAAMTESKPFERLPKSVVPKHYGLTLSPNLTTFVFEGEVNIDLQVSFNFYAPFISLFRMELAIYVG